MAETQRSSASSSSANKSPLSPESPPSKKRSKVAVGASLTDDRPNSEELYPASRIDLPTADGMPVLEKKTGGAPPEQSSALALSHSAGCTAADKDQMGKSQPKVACGKLISQSSQDEAQLADWKENLDCDDEILKVKSNILNIRSFLSRNGYECSDLETICVKYPALTYENLDKIVGFACSHHLNQNKIEASANKAKIVLSRESFEYGIRMGGGWSFLPIDLICFILLHFLPLSDAISLGAVCKEWRSAFLGNKEKLWRRMPCLLIQKRMHKDGRNTFLSLPLYNIRGYKICPAADEFFDNIFISSSQGWLITESPNKIQMVDMYTANLFRLPPFIHKPGPFTSMNFPFIIKAFVVPSSSDRYTVVCMVNDLKGLLMVCQAGGDQ